MDSCFNTVRISTLAFAMRLSDERAVHSPFRTYHTRYTLALCTVLFGILFSNGSDAATEIENGANAEAYADQFGRQIPKVDTVKTLPADSYSAPVTKTLGFILAAGFAHDDNVSRASGAPEKLSDTSYGLTMSKSKSMQFTKYFRLVANGFLDIEKFRNYSGLGHFSGGIQGEFMYRASGEFSAPTFGLFARLTGDNYQSMLRDGSRRSVGLTMRNPLTDRINLYTALENHARTGKSAVFTTRDNALRMNLDYALDTGQTLYLTGEYRKGDIVSSGQPTLKKLDMSIVFVRDDVFISPAFYDYRMQGKTALFTLGYNHSLGNKDSVDFGWRRAQSKPDITPAYATPTNYVDNLYSISYLMAF